MFSKVLLVILLFCFSSSAKILAEAQGSGKAIECLDFWDRLEIKLQGDLNWSPSTSQSSQIEAVGSPSLVDHLKKFEYIKLKDEPWVFSNFQISKFAEQGDPYYLLAYYGRQVLEVLGLSVSGNGLVLPSTKRLNAGIALLNSNLSSWSNLAINVFYYEADDLGLGSYLSNLVGGKAGDLSLNFPLGEDPMIRVHDFTVHLTLDLPDPYIRAVAHSHKILLSFGEFMKRKMNSSVPRDAFYSYLTTYYDQFIGSILPMSRSLSRGTIKRNKRSAKAATLHKFSENLVQSMH